MLLFSSQIWPKFTPPSWADITTWWGRATAYTTPWSTRTTRSCTPRTSGPAWVYLCPPPLQLQHSSPQLLLSVTRRPCPLFQSSALDSCWLVARGSVNTAVVLLNSVDFHRSLTQTTSKRTKRQLSFTWQRTGQTCWCEKKSFLAKNNLYFHFLVQSDSLSPAVH